jgi:proline iminopeptidase
MSPSATSHNPPVKDGYFHAEGAQLYLREVGAGTPLVVLHGGPDFNHNYLLPELDALAATFRLIYYDQRGRGRSSGSIQPQDVSLDSELQDLDRLRMILGLEALSLLGHSFGALLAMEYAARFPKHVTHLVLMNPAPGSYADRLRFVAHRRTHEAANLTRMDQIASTQMYASGDIATEAQYYRVHFSRALKDTRKLEELVSRLRVHFTPADIVKARAIEDCLYEQTWRRPDYDVIARLGQQPPPTLVIHGADDFVPLECSRNLTRGITGSRLEVIEDCGHFAYIDRPAESYELIRAFMESP